MLDSLAGQAASLIGAAPVSDLERPFPEFRDWLPSATPRAWHWEHPHTRYVIDALDCVTAGEIDRLMIFMPPRHLKSQLVTVRYTAYRMERDQTLPVILASYQANLVEGFSRGIRRIMREHQVPFDDERTAVDQWQLARGGALRAVGVGGGLTGHGGRLIVIDDPIRGREAADSATWREKTYEWWQDDLSTRWESPGAIILIVTRWHLDDLAGRILASDDGPSWTVLNLPAIALEGDALGREPGEALWPERLDAARLADIERINPRGYWSLYQGMPQPPGGAILLREWWAGPEGAPRNRYDINDTALANSVAGRYQFWDTAEETNESSAFSSCTTLDVMPDFSVNVREVWRRRLTFPDLEVAIVQQAGKHNYDGKLANVVIENASSGRGLYHTLRRSAPEWLQPMLKNYTPRDSKVDRARAAGLWCSKDLVRLPYPDEHAPWLLAFENEVYDFPTGRYADQVDSLSMGVLYLSNLLQAALAVKSNGRRVDEYSYATA